MRKAAVIFVILCLIAGLGAGAVLYKKYAPTKARADQGAIYGAEGSQVALVLDYELQEQQASTRTASPTCRSAGSMST